MSIICEYPVECFAVSLFVVTHLCYYVTFRQENYMDLRYFLLVEFNNICLFVWTYVSGSSIEDTSFQPHYMFLMLLWADFWTYSSHRILHSRLLYKFVHSIHHQRSYPQPYDTFYCHPFENFFQNWCLIGIPIFLWPLSKLTIAIMGSVFIISSLTAHESRDNTFHANHHKYHNFNFGAGFRFMDKLFHTYIDQID